MGVVLWVPAGDDAEAQGAARWAREQGIQVATGDAPRSSAFDVLWIHAGAAMPLLAPTVSHDLQEWVHAGGVLACTLLATPLAQALGAPGPAPRQIPPIPWSHADDPRWPEAFHQWPDYPHIRGCQGYGPHPLFRGLVNGTFTWMAREGDVVGRCEYLKPEWPDAEGAAVIGVDRSYVHLDADVAVAWEYVVGRGTIRCIGAHLCFASGHPSLHPQRDAVLRNLLAADWLQAERRSAWPTGRRHARVSVIPAPRPLEPVAALPATTPVRRAPAGDAPLTLGTPTGLMTGSESGGVDELWLHPLCLVDGGIAISTSDGELRAASCEVSAAHIERVLESANGERWRERVIGGVDTPAWWYDLTPVNAAGETIGVEFSLPLRLAWPMPADALHPLRTEVRHEAERATVLVTGADARHRVLVALDGVAELVVDAGESSPRLKVIGNAGKGLRLVLQADHGARAPVVPAEIGATLVRTQQARWDDIAMRTPRLEGHDTLAPAFSWARTRLCNFVTSSLSGYRGMAAGYASTRPGWNRSRPGYAWFFGRDTCWCVDALLSLGLFEEARVALRLLVDTMDVSGKVAHEVSTAGVAHYDAADATPLLLRAIGTYAEWTGDSDTVASWWPAVQRALAFAASTVRDADGLPDNTLVGHGWIEMGPLGGGAVTSYMAACWIDALRRLSSMRNRFDDGADAREARQRMERAQAGLGSLTLPDGRLALHRDHAGELEPELTALAAVPIALGIETGPVAHATMTALAASRFQAPWGLRMLPTDSPRYAARAYHGGAVWPLFTGWAALADARIGEMARALERVEVIARLATMHNVGAFDEVLDGDNGTAAGVCSDQAWSAAAMVTPLMRGILGIEARNAGRVCGIHVRVPPALDGLSMHGLRIGETRWSATWRSTATRAAVEVEHLAGPELAFEGRDAEPFVLAPGERRVIDARERP